MDKLQPIPKRFNAMRRTAGCLFISLMLITGTTAADVYKCVSPEGVPIFSDVPCGENAEVVIRQLPTSVDEALAVAIEPFIRPYTSKTYEVYITNQAKRIGSVILPEQWFNASELIRVYGPSPRDSYSFPQPKPIYGTIPGWVVFLFYGPRHNPKAWTIQFQFLSLVRKDIDGVSQSIVRLKSISIKKDGIPFTPATMREVKTLESTGTGEWLARP